MYSFTMENNNFYFYKCQNVTSNKLIRQSGYKCITLLEHFLAAPSKIGIWDPHFTLHIGRRGTYVELAVFHMLVTLSPATAYPILYPPCL